MFLCAKRDQYALFCLTKRFLTKRLLTTKVSKTIDNGNHIAEVRIVGRKKPKIALSDRLKEAKERNLVKWLKIRNTEYTVVPSPNNVEVATLAHGLDKILFNPGVHYLKDPKTQKYNFTPYLENIIQPTNINFDALTPYITSSKDTTLIEMARQYKSRYIGSTSSLSATLSQFYFVMSNFKEVNVSGLSDVFKGMSANFTRGTKIASSVYLKWKDGVYAVDADKSLDGDDTILSEMGKSLEKVLTLEPEEFEKYLKNSKDLSVLEEKHKPESYAYGQFEKFLLRSQLDCYHPNLKNQTFDLKTRAAIPVRLDISNYERYLGYSLKKNKGLYESYEREYYDMIRSAFLKYTFQVRIGHMGGILVAYHNTRKIFGFQYISRKEMDKRLFGSSKMGDKVFRNTLYLLHSILDKATEKYPKQTLRLSFEANQGRMNSHMNIYVEAVPSIEHDRENYAMEPYKDLTVYRLETVSHLNGREVFGPLKFNKTGKDRWSVRYNVYELHKDDTETKSAMFKKMRNLQASVYKSSNDGKKNPVLEKLYKMSEETLQEEAEKSKL